MMKVFFYMFSFTHLLIDTLVIVDDKQGANLTLLLGVAPRCHELRQNQ
jgi:hypothetical protein